MDIVERLREPGPHASAFDLFDEAADDIERLRAALRGLVDVQTVAPTGSEVTWNIAMCNARAALEGGE